MEIRTLRYFLAVAREENMSRAAEILHVTQPTLSKQLKSLEEELGKKLFVRHSFSIALTEEGVLLRNRAEDLISMADKIEQEFLSLDDITGGDLYFGLAESYQIRYLARELHTLKKAYQDLRYHITSGDTEQVTEKLDKGLLDFAVICETPNAAKYNSIPFPESDISIKTSFSLILHISFTIPCLSSYPCIIELVTASDTAVLISAISSSVGSSWAINAATAILANASLFDLLKNSIFISLSYVLFILHLPAFCTGSVQCRFCFAFFLWNNSLHPTHLKYFLDRMIHICNFYFST